MPYDSFYSKLKAGWSKDDLMKYYCLNDNEYEKARECVLIIHSAPCKNGG